MSPDYLTDIIVLLSAAVIAVPLFQSLKLGAIPGFLVAGVVLGPSGLGYIENYDEISHLAEFGVVLLLFIIGVEINPSRLWRMKGLVLGLGSLQVLITGGLITLIVQGFLVSSWKISLLIGLALALSSTAFVLQLLRSRKMLPSKYGRAAVAVLLLQDLAVVPLLAFVSLMATPELTIAEDLALAMLEAVAILGLVIVVARYVLSPLFSYLARFDSPEIFTASALLLVLGTALIMQSIGLSLAMGAFIAGLLIADSSYRHQIVAEIQPFRGLLLGLFFMTMGMSLSIERFLETPFLLLAITALLLAIKFLSLWPLSRLYKIDQRSSISVAALLAQSGEFALVLFALAHSMGLLETVLFQQLLIVVLLSMLVTPLLDKFSYWNFQSGSKNYGLAHEINISEEDDNIKPVVLAGFGRMGHRVGHILDLMEIPYVAIDNNAAVVERERAEGKSVFYGDAHRLEVLKAAGVADAPFVIVSINDQHGTEQVVSSLHATYPQISVFARGHDVDSCRELYKLGAHTTVSETLEASAELARAALQSMGVEDEALETVLKDFRKDYYGKISH
ncbi:MAG: monovalent cation:proton antiporter-2 (CPA2) family protein [Gammaproteobacteria bacterium]|nr:monovalent cation:proton antiporter-2 (CPA2) family protein [Gammaproteobacteria bacterium]